MLRGERREEVMDKTEIEEGRERNKILKKHVDQLMEHFETVQIFVTCQLATKDGLMCTLANNEGAGNFFARRGQVRDWMLRQDEVAASGGDLISPDDDDEENNDDE